MNIAFASVNESGGVSITEFANKFLRQMAIGILSYGLSGKRLENKLRFLNSVGEEELFSLLSLDQIKDIEDAIIPFEAKRLNLKNSVKIDINSLPDNDFRSGWRLDGGTVSVDMDKAREIQMSRIRKKRDKRLTELDQRQYGKEFDAERQKLRDIPQDFDLTKAETPEELKALWPEELKG